MNANEARNLHQDCGIYSLGQVLNLISAVAPHMSEIRIVVLKLTWVEIRDSLKSLGYRAVMRPKGLAAEVKISW